MTIETLFDIDDVVLGKKDESGVVDQINIGVLRNGETSATQITYKVNFTGTVRTLLEIDLHATD